MYFESAKSVCWSVALIPGSTKAHMRSKSSFFILEAPDLVLESQNHSSTAGFVGKWGTPKILISSDFPWKFYRICHCNEQSLLSSLTCLSFVSLSARSLSASSCREKKLGIPPAIHLSIFIVEIGQLWYVPDTYPVNYWHYWFGAIPHLLDKTIYLADHQNGCNMDKKVD